MRNYRLLTILLTAYLVLASGMPFLYAQRRQAQSKDQQAYSLFLDGLKASLTDNTTQAIDLLQQSLKLNPDNAAAHYKLAQLYRLQKEYDNALLHSRQAVKLKPDNEYYYIETAELYGTIGQFSLAARQLQEMLDNTQASPQYYLNIANLYIQLNQPEKALKALEKAEEKLGTNEAIITQRQTLYLKTGNMNKVLETGEELVKLNPNNPDYTLQQAKILLGNNDFPTAQKYLQDYLALHPDVASARFLLGKTLLAQNHATEALQEFLNSFSSGRISLIEKLDITVTYITLLPNQALEPKLFQLTDSLLQAHKEDAEAYAVKGDLLMELDRKTEARKLYHQALELEPGNFSLWQNILSLGLELGRYDSVAQESEEALSLFPNQAVLYYFAGTANLSLKRNKKAVRALEQGLRLSGSNQDLVKIFQTHLGDAYQAAGQHPKSDAAYQAVLAIDPNDPYVLNNYSYYLSLRKEKLSLARKMSEELVETYPDDANYLDTYAWVLFQQKEYEKAADILKKAVSLNTNNGTILEHYGDVLYHMGRTDEAIAQWQQAEKLGQTSAQLKKKIQDRTYYE